jgi:hypothetical protein
MNLNQAATAGIAGAVALTAIHQAAQFFTANAPRMDVLGRRAITATLDRGGWQAPAEPALQRWALAGDLAANSLYYSLVAAGRRSGAWGRGAALGIAAGAGALMLPQRMGLGAPPRSHSVANQIMTIAWYTLGGLVAAAVAASFRDRTEPAERLTLEGFTE